MGREEDFGEQKIEGLDCWVFIGASSSDEKGRTVSEYDLSDMAVNQCYCSYVLGANRMGIENVIAKRTLKHSPSLTS